MNLTDSIFRSLASGHFRFRLLCSDGSIDPIMAFGFCKRWR